MLLVQILGFYWLFNIYFSKKIKIIMQDQKKKDDAVLAQVIEALPNTFFKVKRLDNEEEMLTYLSGKMRLHRIRVLVGDKVAVEIDPYGGKGRIVKRV
jgi:translation initiation factor IF-1